MKIAFVQSGLGAGGAEKIVNLLAQHRLSLGDEVHVFAFSEEPNGSYFPYDKRIHIETPPPSALDSGGRLLRVAGRLKWLRSRFKAQRPDLVVSFLTRVNVMVMLASLGLRIPVVISERNNPLRQGAHPFWYPTGIALARGAGAVVMQTEAAYDMLPKSLKSRALVIPNPCVIPSNKHRSDGDGSTIVAVGRLVRQKGFDLLIDAVARLSADLPRVKLIIFGEGPDRGALEAKARALGVADRVSLPGITATPGAWISAGDVFVLSSRYEGFPNVLVEALAGGLPAVAFDCPWGPADILTHEKNGMLVPAENVEALAASLKRVLNDPAMRRRISAAAPSAAARFSLKNVLASWDAILVKTATTSAGGQLTADKLL
jgi:glycosyltransferase involved in cell wall biosynthesis